MGYRLTNRATEDLIDIFIEGTRCFGRAQAHAYHGQFSRTFELLADFPGLAPERPELSPPMRIHPLGAHVIVYQITDDGDVLIVRIRHGREDWLNAPLG